MLYLVEKPFSTEHVLFPMSLIYTHTLYVMGLCPTPEIAILQSHNVSHCLKISNYFVGDHTTKYKSNFEIALLPDLPSRFVYSLYCRKLFHIKACQSVRDAL